MEKQRSKKILVNVVEPLITGINTSVEAACLLRDAYLDRVFLHEAEQLEREMPAANSPEAKAELSRHLKMLKTKPVNFSLSEETVQAVNEACADMNVPRDCFINRVLLFLSLNKKPAFFDRLLGFELRWYWQNRVFDLDLFERPDFLAGSLTVVQEVIASDPFGPVRACIEAAREDEEDLELLHGALMEHKFFPKKTFKSSLGFNCHLPDSWIEGHPAKKAADELWDSVVASLNAEPSSDDGHKERKGGDQS